MTPCRLAIALLLTVSLSVSAQDTTKPKPESARGGMMEDHMMGPWKEMNAFHTVMAATWHPASQKNDLAPLRSRAKELLTTADAWAASKAPAMHGSCATDSVRTSVTKVASQSKALLSLVDNKADDAALKAALKELHDAFEVVEKACGGHGDQQSHDSRARHAPVAGHHRPPVLR